MNKHYVPGEIQLFSKVRYGKTKKGISLYRFIPFHSEYPIAKVATTFGKTHGEQTNIYAVVEYDQEALNKKEVSIWKNILVKATLIDILGLITDKIAGLLAIQYTYLGYNATRTSKRKKFILKETNFMQNYEYLSMYPYKRNTERTLYNPKIICTIDPIGCQDIDDAISFEILNSTTAIVGVHITDVDEVVKENSGLDKWFQEQPFTLYRPDKNQNSLPEEVSTNICSLCPNQKRATLSVLYYLNYENEKDLKIKQITPELNAFVIESKEKLTYSEATKKINNSPEWKQFSLFIKKWQQFESKYSSTLEEKSEETDSFSHNMIAFLMIRTNAYIAEKLLSSSTENVLLRTQYKSENNDNTFEKEIEESMKKINAEYVLSNKEIPHTSLQLSAYTHFTSPIRRYPDLVVHRDVKSKLLPFLKQKKVEIINCEFLNNFEKNLHRVESSWNWWQYIQEMNNLNYTMIEEKGIILDWGHFNDDLRYGLSVLIQFGKRKAWVRVVHPYLINLVKIIRTENTIEVNLISENVSWKVEKFQEVKIKCWWDSSRGIRGIRFHWITPPLPNFFSKIDLSLFEESKYTLQDWM